MNLEPFLETMVERKAADLFISVGAPPSAKIHGKLVPLNKTPVTEEQARAVAYSLMNERQREEFDQTSECNFAIRSRIGRFRVSCFIQQTCVGMVLRRIEEEIPELEDLELPSIIQKLAMMRLGLILFVGGTGTGKSSSLAAVIGYRNRNSNGHIITIEDPIEFVHKHQNCIVNQREVGVDTESYDVALRNSLRQAPDVIMLGEIRSVKTMGYAMHFAESGHLCVSTLHANSANQALERIINFFPADDREQALFDLSINLRAIVAQKLVPVKSGGRRAVIEIMLNTPLIADLIHKGEITNIKPIIAKSRNLGMQTFDQSLFGLFKEGEISAEEAMSYADSPNDLRLMIKLNTDVGGEELRKAAEKFVLEKTPEDEEKESKKLSIKKLAEEGKITNLGIAGISKKIKEIDLTLAD